MPGTAAPRIDFRASTPKIRGCTMKLRVENITEETRTCDFSQSVAEMNDRLAAGPHDFRFARPLDVHLEHYRADDDLVFSGSIRTAARGECARCTEEFPLEVEAPFQFVLQPEAGRDDDDRNQLRGEDLALSTYAGDEIDLAPLVEEQVLLALPTRALCKEDCRGLCPTCGANRNLENCRCQPEQGDPRLAVLRTLAVGRAG